MKRSPAASGAAGASDPVESYRQLVDEAPGGLLSGGGAFANFPGAVLIAGHNGIVLTANDLAEPIGQVLQSGQHEELRAAVQAALAGHTAQVNPLIVTAGEGGAAADRAFDVVVLPWAGGTVALVLGRDVTLERSLRAALVESRQRYKDLVEISNDFAWETDAQGHFVFVSPRGALGYPATELVGRDAAELLLDHAGSEGGAWASPFTARNAVEEAELWVRSAGGAEVCLLATALPLTSGAGAWIGARGVCRDITSLRCHEAELAEARNRERLFSYIVNMVRRELDPARMLDATAEALMPALALTGLSIHALDDGALGQLLAEAGKPVHVDLLAALVKRLEGERTSVELRDAAGDLLVRATRYRDETNGLLCAWRASGSQGWTAEDRSLLDNIAGQVALAIEQLDRQTEMTTLSMTDPLTGLNNRRGFVDRLGALIADDAVKAKGALFYIDLDNFKQVNDTHGHQTGDEALLEVAALMKEQIRGGDLAARLGGDEFALFLCGIDRAAAERKGGLLLKAAERLRGFSGDAGHPLGISLGLALYDPRTGESLEALFRRADAAMYEAKRAGKHSLRLAADHERRGGA
ncbi:MAG: diguanylate cyclase domain-containing protein [Bacteroidota bacterium]|nr:diguanylate cyclase [Kiloniellaceae bacterium]